MIPSPSDCPTTAPSLDRSPILVHVSLVSLALLLGFTAAASGQDAIVECSGCHAEEARQFEESVHRGAAKCQECHGGPSAYMMSLEQRRLFGLEPTDSSPAMPRPKEFDHGDGFRGKASRAEIPERCGTCHADVARMNPYGLPTDQMASYWVSGHGKRLKKTGDENVAVCTDCHGVHDVLRSDNPNSRTHFRRIPDTCGSCHSNVELMAKYNIPAGIVDQYRRSVHGRNLLERGDPGSPHCATCHGNHAAAPPGYRDVGHVCGQCHKQIEDYFMKSVHGRIPVMARCIGCHAKGGQRWNHEIEEASPSMEGLTALYERLTQREDLDDDELRKRFTEGVHQLSGSVRLDTVCAHCHGHGRADPHAIFFEKTDREALEYGHELARMLTDAQLAYARTATRIDRLARGVLLVREESLRAADAKTELMALTAAIHTLDREDITARCEKVNEICAEVGAQLDRKETGLQRRRMAMLAFWVVAAVFGVLMYQKYLQLKRQYVRTAAGEADHVEGPPSPGRRRWLDVVLSGMGAATLVGLIWPAVAYMLPARGRRGAIDRVSVGNEADWPVWEARKVSVGGTPVAVIRTSQDFRAYSAVCTHLGCIVHWEPNRRVFNCPCHAASFDMSGQVVSGPPPRPLPEYRVLIAQGEVFVTGPLEG